MFPGSESASAKLMQQRDEPRVMQTGRPVETGSGAIGSAAQQLGANIEILEEVVGRLRGRLNPALRPAPPSPVGGSGVNGAGPSMCDIASTFFVQSNRVESITDQLRDILERVDI